MDVMRRSTTFTNSDVGGRMVQTVNTERKTRKGLQVKVSKDSYLDSYAKRSGGKEGTGHSRAGISTSASTCARARNTHKRNPG